MIEYSYKESKQKEADKSHLYFHFFDHPPNMNINNYNFLDQKKEEGESIEVLSISNAIESLKNELENKKLDSLSESDGTSIFQGLVQINELMKKAEIKFGYKNISDFPYLEISDIIANCANNDIKMSAIECLKMAIKFDSDSIESKITESAIISLEQMMNDDDEKLSNSAISLIGYINIYSQTLCEEFCLSGLITALIKHLPSFYAFFAVQTSIANCPSEFSLKFLFLLFKTVSNTYDEIIIEHFFHGILIFVAKYGIESLPDQITDEEIEPAIKYECKNIIIQLLKCHIINSVRFSLVTSMVEFCSYIPDLYPIEIIPKLLQYLIDESLFELNPELVENISRLLILSSERCEKFIQRNFLKHLFKLIRDDLFDFRISFSYAKLIVVFHQIQLDDFDIYVIELCARYICCSENSFSTQCIILINEIINQFSIHGQLEKMVLCIQILNESRENLESRIEDPEISSCDEINIHINSILGVLNKYKEIVSKYEENET